MPFSLFVAGIAVIYYARRFIYLGLDIVRCGQVEFRVFIRGISRVPTYFIDDFRGDKHPGGVFLNLVEVSLGDEHFRSAECVGLKNGTIFEGWKTHLPRRIAI